MSSASVLQEGRRQAGAARGLISTYLQTDDTRTLRASERDTHRLSL